MAQASILFVGLDVHKETIAVAYVGEEREAEVVSLGTIGTRQGDLDKCCANYRQRAKHYTLGMRRDPVGIGCIGT